MRYRRTAILFGALAALTMGNGDTSAARAAARPLDGRVVGDDRALDNIEARFVRDFEAFIAHARNRLPMVPALSIAVVRGDRPLYVNAFGYADMEARVPATADTRFYIGSSTKSFTALALALLDARGDIDLDWTLAELAPEVEFDPRIRANEVTLRHMLSHTHGFKSRPIVFRLAYTGEQDTATLWRLLPSLQPNVQNPLGRFDYDNIGYNVATLLIEKRLGRPWQEIVEREVLVPIGLAQTVTRGLDRARARAAFAVPYDSLQSAGFTRLHMVKADETMQSAGGIFSSAHDMALWLQLNLDAASARRTPLPGPVIAATHRPIVAFSDRFHMFDRSGYGLGWHSGDYGGATLFHSFGDYAGARAHVSFMPVRDVGVSVLTNDEGAGYYLADVAAAYVYDWFGSGPEAADRTARKTIDWMVERAAGRPAQRAAARAERAQRPWRLSVSPEAYTGRYCSADLGTIAVARRDGRLAMTWGRLEAEFEPYAEEDTVRVERVPNSDGQVLKFGVEHGVVTTLHLLDSDFSRCA